MIPDLIERNAVSNVHCVTTTIIQRVGYITPFRKKCQGFHKLIEVASNKRNPTNGEHHLRSGVSLPAAGPELCYQSIEGCVSIVKSPHPFHLSAVSLDRQ